MCISVHPRTSTHSPGKGSSPALCLSVARLSRARRGFATARRGVASLWYSFRQRCERRVVHALARLFSCSHVQTITGRGHPNIAAEPLCVCLPRRRAPTCALSTRSRSCASEHAHAPAYTARTRTNHLCQAPTGPEARDIAPSCRRVGHGFNLTAPVSPSLFVPFEPLQPSWNPQTSLWHVWSWSRETSLSVRQSRAAAPLGHSIERQAAHSKTQRGFARHTLGHTWVRPKPIRRIWCGPPITY
jgi:hypothetical protein